MPRFLAYVSLSLTLLLDSSGMAQDMNHSLRREPGWISRDDRTPTLIEGSALREDGTGVRSRRSSGCGRNSVSASRGQKQPEELEPSDNSWSLLSD